MISVAHWRRAAAVVAGSALLWATAQAQVENAPPSPPPSAALPLLLGGSTNMLETAYVEPTNGALRPIYDRLKKRRVLEDMREFLSSLRLPRKLSIKLQGCDGVVNAWYTAGTLTYCYELDDQIAKNRPKGTTVDGVTPEDAMMGPFVDIFLHEMSHALFDILKVPVFGREEDAADQLAAFILLQFGNDVARRTLLGTAVFWGSLAKTPADISEFADEHGLPAQRFYNIVCIAYGANPTVFKDFAAKYLPKERAERCPFEYQQVRYAYLHLIAPYVDAELQKKVMARSWLKADDGK